MMYLDLLDITKAYYNIIHTSLSTKHNSYSRMIKSEVKEENVVHDLSIEVPLKTVTASLSFFGSICT